MIAYNKACENDEERLLISKVADLSAKSENRAVASSFLTPREQIIVHSYFRSKGGLSRLMMWGGLRGCERRRAVFLPSWINADPIEESLFSEKREDDFIFLLSNYGMNEMLDEFFCKVLLSTTGYNDLSHRDWLGGLMSLQISREKIGDILVVDGKTAYTFADPVISKYICLNLERVGQNKVGARETEIPKDFSIERKYEDVFATVASPRIDGVVRALCNISREESARLVTTGNVLINYFANENADARVSSGDILSVRGYGKFTIISADELTKKGRIRLVAKKYV